MPDGDDLWRIIKLEGLINTYFDTDIDASKLAEMLIETNQSAETISAAVGFGTKSSFYREFRQSYGITPMEYRRLYGRYE